MGRKRPFPLATIVTIVAGLLTLFAVAPKDWNKSLSAWLSFFGSVRGVAFLIAAVIIIAVRPLQVAATSHGKTPRRDAEVYPLLQPSTGDPTKPGAFELAVEAVKDVNSTGSPEHFVRIRGVDGTVSIGLLDRFVTEGELRGDWTIRVLIVHPESPNIRFLEPGAKNSIWANVCKVYALKRELDASRSQISIEIRGVEELPERRGFMIDKQHLFLGHTAWARRDGRPRLDLQKQHIVHMRRVPGLAEFIAESMLSWFDHEWDAAKPIDPPTEEDS